MDEISFRRSNCPDHARRRTMLRSRLLTSGLFAGLAFLGALSTQLLAQEATEDARTTETQVRRLAEEQRALADKARQEAEVQTQRAEAALRVAERERERAEQERLRAEQALAAE